MNIYEAINELLDAIENKDGTLTFALEDLRDALEEHEQSVEKMYITGLGYGRGIERAECVRFISERNKELAEELNARPHAVWPDDYYNFNKGEEK